jgi:hypothetical protein
MPALADAPPRRRLLRRAVIAAGALVTLLAVLLAGGLFWPAPRPALRCGPGDGAGCRAVSGRVLYVPHKDRSQPSRALHLVLLSRDSSTLPLISVVKIPARMRPRETPGRGTWMSAVGTPHRGSNGETDLGVQRYEASTGSGE